MNVIDVLVQAEETIDNLVGPEERESYSDTIGAIQRAIRVVEDMKNSLQDVVAFMYDPNMSQDAIIDRCENSLKRYKEV